MESTFKQDIADVVLPEAARIAQERDLHVLRVIVRGAQHTPVIEVVIDGPKLVTIEDCESISRQLNEWIETAKNVKGNFRLDVMSPGVEEPLEFDWQFERSMGRLVEVHYEDGGESHTVHGKLRGITKDMIAIEPIHLHRTKKQSNLGRIVDDAGNGSANGRATSAETIDPEIASIADDAVEAVLKEDEQLYNDEVALVSVDREKITKVVGQIEWK